MSKGKNKLTDAQVSQLVRDVHDFGVNTYTREIFLNGYLGDCEEDPGVDYRSAQVFLKNLLVLEALGWSKITIHMTIGGGSWESGMAMFDAIRAAKSHVEIIAYAQASSMSGVLLQAGDTRIMTPNCHFMLHYGSVGINATSQAVSSAVAFNDAENRKMVEIFAARAVEGQYFKSKRWGTARVAEFIDSEIRRHGDWYLTASQAVDMGFADRVLGLKN